MGENFGRSVRIEIAQPGAALITLRSVLDDGSRGLTLSARTTYTSDRQDNVCDVTGWNLSPTTRSALQVPGTVCRVLAGYAVPLEIAAGRVKAATIVGPVRAPGSADESTAWQITDGGVDLRDVVISETWAGQVLASQIVKRVASRIGLATGGDFTLGQDVQYATGYGAWGTARDVLAGLAVDTLSNIVVQGATLLIWPVGQPLRQSGPLLSPDTGLLGTPQRQPDDRWSVVSQLVPGARPGDYVTVRSSTLNGVAHAVDVSHEVDSRTGPFRTTWTLRRIS